MKVANMILSVLQVTKLYGIERRTMMKQDMIIILDLGSTENGAGIGRDHLLSVHQRPHPLQSRESSPEHRRGDSFLAGRLRGYGGSHRQKQAARRRHLPGPRHGNGLLSGQRGSDLRLPGLGQDESGYGKRGPEQGPEQAAGMV